MHSPPHRHHHIRTVLVLALAPAAIEEALRAHVRKLALVQPSAQAPDDYSITFRRIIARLDQSIMLFSRL